MKIVTKRDEWQRIGRRVWTVYFSSNLTCAIVTVVWLYYTQKLKNDGTQTYDLMRRVDFYYGLFSGVVFGVV